MEAIEVLRTEGPAACEALLESVIIGRRSAALKHDLTLQEIALKAIVNTTWLWTPESYLKLADHFNRTLPVQLKLQILEKFNAIWGEKKEILHPHQWKLVELLMYGPTFKMDLTPWKSRISNARSLMQLVLHFCPRLKETLDRAQAEAAAQAPEGHILRCYFTSLDRTCLDEHEKMWQVTPRVLRLNYTRKMELNCTGATPDMWENLELLDISIPTVSFDILSTSLASDLKNLRELHIWLTANIFQQPKPYDAECTQAFARKLVLMVLKLPALQVFGCSTLREHPCTAEAFVDEFGKLAPEKMLLVDYLMLGYLFTAIWPVNLRVRHLHLYNPEDTKVIEQLCKISTDQLKTITLERFFRGEHEYTYKLLDVLAAKATRLEVKYVHKKTIDLHRMLAAAPCLEEFEINLDSLVFTTQVEQPTASRVDASYFQKMKTFTIAGRKDPIPVDDVLKDLFEMYLLNSTVDWTLLNITEPIALNSVHSMLLEHPHIGARTRRLRLSCSSWYLVPKALTVAALLVLRSPWLESIDILVPPVPIDEWDQEHPEHNMASTQWLKDLAAAVGVKCEIGKWGRAVVD